MRNFVARLSRQAAGMIAGRGRRNSAAHLPLLEHHAGTSKACIGPSTSPRGLRHPAQGRSCARTAASRCGRARRRACPRRAAAWCDTSWAPPAAMSGPSTALIKPGSISSGSPAHRPSRPICRLTFPRACRSAYRGRDRGAVRPPAQCPGERVARAFLGRSHHRNAAVCTGASHRRASSASSAVTVIEQPAISSEVQ